MQNKSKSKDNWSVVFDQLDPDIVLAQESLPPDQCQRPLSGDKWVGLSDHSPVVADIRS